MCRTSPSAELAGDRPGPGRRTRRRARAAISPTVCGCAGGDVVRAQPARRRRRRAASAARLARATSRTWTKSRRWPPSSKTRGASPRSSAGPEDRGHPGVRGVARHPRAVHVVVAQRGDRAAGLPGPGRGQVLLRELGGGVDAARVAAERPRRPAPGSSGAPQHGQGGSKRPAARSVGAARAAAGPAPCAAQR